MPFSSFYSSNSLLKPYQKFKLFSFIPKKNFLLLPEKFWWSIFRFSNFFPIESRLKIWTLHKIRLKKFIKFFFNSLLNSQIWFSIPVRDIQDSTYNSLLEQITKQSAAVLNGSEIDTNLHFSLPQPKVIWTSWSLNKILWWFQILFNELNSINTFLLEKYLLNLEIQAPLGISNSVSKIILFLFFSFLLPSWWQQLGDFCSWFFVSNINSKKIINAASMKELFQNSRYFFFFSFSFFPNYWWLQFLWCLATQLQFLEIQNCIFFVNGLFFEPNFFINFVIPWSLSKLSIDKFFINFFCKISFASQLIIQDWLNSIVFNSLNEWLKIIFNHSIFVILLYNLVVNDKTSLKNIFFFLFAKIMSLQINFFSFLCHVSRIYIFILCRRFSN